MWNLANMLTLSRFVTAPLYLYCVLRMEGPASSAYSAAAFIILVVSMLTDMFDGIVARAQKQVTHFGEIMDPVADSTFFLTALFAFAAAPRFSGCAPEWLPIPLVWFPVVALYRETAMHVLRRYAALAGVILPAQNSGKAKTFFQAVALIAITGVVALHDSGYIDWDFRPLVFWSFSAIAVASVLSMLGYLGTIPRLSIERKARLAEGQRKEN